MREKSDFPALSASLVRIQRVANSDSVSLAALSDEILKDVALTNKLLRIVNSAHYSHSGAGTVSTVSRAAALVGFAGIRNMAMSLVLLEHMHDKGHAKQIQEEFLRALMAGALAEELSSVGRDGEEAFIGAMFFNLGRLLTQYYLPAEAQAIRNALKRAQSASGSESAAQVDDTASRRVLGLSYEDLGLGMAKAWGLPPTLMRCMQRSGAEPPQKLVEKSDERVRWLTLAASEMTDALLEPDPEVARTRLAGVAKRYRRALGREADEFDAAALGARTRVAEMVQAMNLHLDTDSSARRLLPGDVAPTVEALDDLPGQLAPSAILESAPLPPEASAKPAAEVLAAGIQAVANSMVESFHLDDMLRQILEIMRCAMGFRRVLLCLRDVKGEALAGRLGVGADAQASVANFKVVLNTRTDLFSIICNKGVDTLISDATVANIAQRLPDWYRSGINAPAFLLLPLQLKGKPFGLIYADKAQAGAIALADNELAQLRTLRNQAVMAFRQSS